MKSWDNWKGFERLVAALHISASQGGTVKWNDNINGRQFDVSIRFSYSGYEYLTVIECRDYKNKVPVGDLDAFATKSNDINANKAIMVTPIGFQEGCIAVAERHGIELLILNENQKESPEILSGKITPVINYSELSFIRSDNEEELRFPDTAGGKLLFLVKKAEIETPNETITIERLLRRWYNINIKKINNVTQYYEMRMPAGAKLIIPNPIDKETIPIKCFRYGCAIIEGRLVKLSGLDPLLEANKLKTISIQKTNGTKIIEKKISDIPYGFDNEITKGKYYKNPTNDFIYYVKDIVDDIVNWILLESYQHGTLLQAEFSQTLDNAKAAVREYIEIADSKEIIRLKRILDKFLIKKTAQ